MSKRSEAIAESDRQWNEEKERNGWELPKTHWFFKLPIIRYIRWVYHNICLDRHLSVCRQAGLGLFVQPYDEWRMWAIYRGWA
jgi:hypothetical protein